MNKIREILEKYLGHENEFGTVPRDIMFSEHNGTFDELEKELQEYTINKYEIACLEFLKGCDTVTYKNPEDCEECLKAFIKAIKNIKKSKVI